ncbi:MAG: hypothetical protein P8Y14_17775 [Anaerolineales bacterium]|jgi:hypothetical protein
MPLKHSAIRAWCELRRVPRDAELLEAFKVEGQSASVYRLVWVGKTGPSMIAKRSRQSTARVERIVYEEILPNLPLPTLRYHGSVAEPDGEYWWLFLEDVSSDEKYLPHIKEHRIAAAQWLGIMNTVASGSPAAACLPERGPGHYLHLLHSARQTIQSNFSNPVLNAGHLVLLENILAQCEYLSVHWNELGSACEGIPLTVVHGDFIRKNVRVRYTQDGIVILPFDWEKAGWGIPAEDISRVDLPTYWSTVQEYWPTLTIQSLNRLINVGKIFRCLVFLDWIAPSLAFASVEQPINDIRRCESWLAGLIRTAEWRN